MLLLGLLVVVPMVVSIILLVDVVSVLLVLAGIAVVVLHLLPVVYVGCDRRVRPSIVAFRGTVHVVVREFLTRRRLGPNVFRSETSAGRFSLPLRIHGSSEQKSQRAITKASKLLSETERREDTIRFFRSPSASIRSD